MVPNMKAIDRLEDVEAKLVDTEKEADKARKDSRNAKETFNDVKKKRYAFLLLQILCYVLTLEGTGRICSQRRTNIFRRG
jgi:hypothetical protein